ncbi:hypothetical protein V6N13_101090 [Hibiscus sabdariffa]
MDAIESTRESVVNRMEFYSSRNHPPNSGDKTKEDTLVTVVGITRKSLACSMGIPMEEHSSSCVVATDIVKIATPINLTTALPNLSGPPKVVVVDPITVECREEDVPSATSH